MIIIIIYVDDKRYQEYKRRIREIEDVSHIIYIYIYIKNNDTLGKWTNDSSTH